ncbi:MAG: protein kinase domain-containing protein [Lactobacillus kalixensis]|uniref:class III lanthionine synthetase LanKC N-terminal domain-containing protein n=1 Tax=Lactobacillus kalixensis TaxID=227944 RepID=UPI003995E63D
MNYDEMIKNYGLKKDKNSIWAYPVNQDEYNYNSNDFGIKIHISASIINYKYILKKFIKWNSYNIGYKVVNSFDNLCKLNSGRYGYSQTGKFITIYPKNNSKYLLKILEELYKIFAEFQSPRIPSDYPFLDSKVVYVRYGEIHGNSTNSLDKRDGSIPEIAKKILPTLAMKSYKKFPDNLIVLSILRKNAKGGVYKALDLKLKQIVILKEAMSRNTVLFDGTSSVLNLFREGQLLKKFKFDLSPKFIDIFWIGENLFLEEEYIKGPTLENLIEQQSIKENDKNNIMLALLDAINKFHSETKMIINDISPANIIITNNNIKLIDFEFSVENRSNIPLIYGTSGFHDDEYNFNDYTVDHYGICMCYFYILNPEKYTKNLKINKDMISRYEDNYIWFKNSIDL